MIKKITHTIYEILFSAEKLHLIKRTISYLKCYFLLRRINTKNAVAISLIEHIGDIIANEPISREIKKMYPESTIIWFVRPTYKSLLQFNPSIDKVITVNCLTVWILIKRKFSFKAFYDLHFNGRTCNKCMISLKKENVNDTVTGSNYFQFGGLLDAVCLHNNITVSDKHPKIYLPNSIIAKVSKILPEEYIVIHCKSNEDIKDWETEKWNQLVTILLSNFKYTIIEIGTRKLVNIENKKYKSYCGKLTILESAAVIKNAKLFISIDSGPAHMANAWNTPGIILLGEYYFGMKDYNPYTGNYRDSGNGKLIYSKARVKDITVDDVVNAVEEFVN